MRLDRFQQRRAVVVEPIAVHLAQIRLEQTEADPSPELGDCSRLAVALGQNRVDSVECNGRTGAPRNLLALRRDDVADGRIGWHLVASLVRWHGVVPGAVFVCEDLLDAGHEHFALVEKTLDAIDDAVCTVVDLTLNFRGAARGHPRRRYRRPGPIRTRA